MLGTCDFTVISNEKLQRLKRIEAAFEFLGERCTEMNLTDAEGWSKEWHYPEARGAEDLLEMVEAIIDAENEEYDDGEYKESGDPLRGL